MGVDLEKRFATELNRLLDTDRGLELDPRAQARRLEERQEQLRRLLDELSGPSVEAALEAWPGRSSAVAEVIRGLRRRGRSPREVGDAFTKLPWQPRATTFDAYRASALSQVVARLSDRKLRRATLGAADAAIAGRLAQHPDHAKSSAGQALWRAAERRAATLYRYAQEAGDVASEDPVIEEALARCGQGQPLPPAVRAEMERELGISLDRVRIHTDGVAAAAARAVRATAFTVGDDIFFADGAFDPASAQGRRLLAHELTHVAQSYQGRTRTGGDGIEVSQPGHTLEREADAFAERVATSPARNGSAAQQYAAPQVPTARDGTLLLRQEAASSSSSTAGESGGTGAEAGEDAAGARGARGSFEVRDWTAGSSTAGESGAVHDGATHLVHVQSSGLSARADVRALTSAAQRYSVGFVQTMHHSTRRAIYTDADGNVVNTYVATRGRVMDQRTDLRSPAPWYNYGLLLGAGTRTPAMTDNPTWEVPRSTSDHWYVSRLEGSESFTTYLVAMIGTDASTIVYLGNVRWDVNWAGRFDSRLHFHGSPAHVGRARLGGAGGAVLSGPAANEGPMGAWEGAGSPRGAGAETSTSTTRSAHGGPAGGHFGGEGAAQPAGDAKHEDRGGRRPKGSAPKPKEDAAGAGPAGSKPGAGGAKTVAGGKGGDHAFSGGGIDGAPLKQQLGAFNQLVDQHTATVKQPEGTDGSPKKDSAEDHDKKVAQYEDGVDGIADMIGDTDGFDEICDGFSTFGDDKAKQQSGLAKVRQTKAFAQLTKMWQGALDGGTDSARMQAAYERQFSGRGFWGSTEQAFHIVKEDAKRQAREDAEAAAAKKRARDAAANAKEKTAANADAAANTAAGKGSPQTVHGGHGGANAAFLNAAVPEKAAPLTQVLAMAKDGEFRATLASVDHHTGLVMSAQKEDTQARRRDQIWEQFKRAGSGFKEGFWETAKWGIIAHAGNKIAGGAIEKLVGEKVPVIGPIIMLALDPPWKAEYWEGVGKGFSKGGHQLASVIDLEPFEHCKEPKDYVGVICAKLADLFGGFYEILTTINRLLGTLSALALILGAVLIGIGCALAWLGVGAGLIAAGGWLVEAGEVLGDISLALMPVCLALSAISLLFRTAAAYWVPADLYGDQLVAEGDAADKFGNQAGQRVGLATARAVEEATPIPENPPKVHEEGGGSTAHTEAHADAAKVAETSKGAADAMSEAGKGMAEQSKGAGENKGASERKAEPQEHAADEHTAAKGEGEQTQSERKAAGEEHEGGAHDKKGKGHEEKTSEREQGNEKEQGKEPSQEHGEEHAKTAEAKKSVGRRFAESLKAQLKAAIKGSVQLGKNIERLGDSLGDARELFSREATNRGLSRGHEAFEKLEPKFEGKLEKLNEHIEELGKTAEAADTRFKEAYDKLMADDGKLTLQQEADLRQQLDEAAKASADAEKAIRHAQRKAESLKDALESFERAEQGGEQDRMPTEEQKERSAAQDNGTDPHSNAKLQSKAEAARKQARGELVEAKVEHAKIEREVETADARLREARRSQREAERTVEGMEADPANASKVEAGERVAKHEARLEKARELDRKAGEIERNDHRYRKAQKGLDNTVGKTVEVDGTSHKIVGFGADGVIVEPAGGGPRRSVAADAVKGELPGDFAKQVEALRTTKANLDRLTDGETGGNPGGVAAKLHETANQIRHAEQKNYSSPKKQARWAETKKTAREWEAEKGAVSDPAARELESAQRQLEAKQKELADNEQSQKDLEHTIAENDARADAARRARGDHRRTEKALEKGFEIVLHLLNFDRMIDALLKVTGLQARIDSLKEMIGWHVEKEEEPAVHGAPHEGGAEEARREGEEHAAAAQKEEDEHGEGGEEHHEAEPAHGAEGKEGGAHGEGEHGFERHWYNEREEVEHEHEAELEEAREEAQHAGAEEASFEQLLAFRPPADVIMLAGYRERAANAAARYAKAHAQAFRAYKAELAVTRLAEESKAMAESGKPIHKRAQGMKAPIEKSKADESQRKAKLEGGDTSDVKGADSKMGGLVVDLISKLADNSDHLSQRPDGGGVKGDDMAGSQDKAASEGKERTEQSKSHSGAQQKFLDEALQVRAKQEASVAQNIQSLEGKSREEFAIRDGIRVQKAQALTEEAAARDEAESNAAQFNEGYARAAAWAQAYEAKRKGSKSGGGE